MWIGNTQNLGSPLNGIHQWDTETKLATQRKSTQGIKVKIEEILLLRKHKAYFLNTQSLPYSFQPNNLYRCLEQPSKHRKMKLHSNDT
jgi:hypothetical protein